MKFERRYEDWEYEEAKKMIRPNCCICGAKLEDSLDRVCIDGNYCKDCIQIINARVANKTYRKEANTIEEALGY